MSRIVEPSCERSTLAGETGDRIETEAEVEGGVVDVVASPVRRWDVCHVIYLIHLILSPPISRPPDVGYKQQATEVDT